VPLSIVGLAGAASVIYFYPDAVASIPTAKGLTVAGVAGLVGKVLNIDEYLIKHLGKLQKEYSEIIEGHGEKHMINLL